MRIYILAIVLLAVEQLCIRNIASNYVFADVIKKIVVDGNTRTDMATIEKYLSLKIGQEYQDNQATKSIKALYDLGRFGDVSIKFSNGICAVHLVEMPMIENVYLSGSSVIKNGDIRDHIRSLGGNTLDNSKIQYDINVIDKICKGNGVYLVNITPEIKELENDRVRLSFNVVNGPRAKVQKIYFTGNDHVLSSLLKRRITTRENKWYKFWTSSAVYGSEKLEKDKEAIVQYYKSLGFVNCSVISANVELSDLKDMYYITFAINEGLQYHIKTANLDNTVDDLDISSLKRILQSKIKEGAIYNISKLDIVKNLMIKELARLGFHNTVVEYTHRENQDNGFVDIDFTINKADQIVINKINIIGNFKTKDTVIRKAMTMTEGGVFTQSGQLLSRQRILSSGFFGDAQIYPVQSGEKLDLITQVAERSTSGFRFQGSYNTTNGLGGQIAFNDNNIIGTGRSFGIDINIADKSHDIRIDFGTESNFANRDIELGLGIGATRSQKDIKSGGSHFDLSAQYVTTELGYSISDNVKHKIEYLLGKYSGRLLEDEEQKKQLSVALLEEEGGYIVSAITNTMSYNTLDNPAKPHFGLLASVSQKIGGIFSENKFLKHEGSIKYFHSFLDDDILTLKLGAHVGYACGWGERNYVRASERFTLGGMTMRGFDGAAIGPKDKCTPQKQNLSGKKMYLLSADLMFPLGLAEETLPEGFGIDGRLFVDYGAAWDADLIKGTKMDRDNIYDNAQGRLTIGFGFDIVTPMIPVTITFGFPIVINEEYEKPRCFSMSMVGRL